MNPTEILPTPENRIRWYLAFADEAMIALGYMAWLQARAAFNKHGFSNRWVILLQDCCAVASVTAIRSLNEFFSDAKGDRRTARREFDFPEALTLLSPLELKLVNAYVSHPGKRETLRPDLPIGEWMHLTIEATKKFNRHVESLNLPFSTNQRDTLFVCKAMMDDPLRFLDPMNLETVVPEFKKEPWN